MVAPSFLSEKVRFESPALFDDGQGGTINGWTPEFSCRAQFIYARGGESVEAARLQGRSIFKVRIRQCAAASGIQQSWRMVDARRGTAYNIREIDQISDRQWVYLLVESGVAG